MDQIISGLIEKVGLSEEQAKAVITFLQAHADKLPALLGASGLAAGLPGGLGGLMGGGAATEEAAAEAPANPLSSLFG